MRPQFCWMAASWCLQSLCSQEHWPKGTQLHVLSTLSSRNVPCSVGNHSQWWVSESIQARDCNQVLQWCLAMFLPSDIHLFCRLSWKVIIHLCKISILKGSYHCYRILLASIWNLGRCPCPHCLIPLDHVQNMGMCCDMMQHMSLAQVNNLEWHRCIKAVQEIIYLKNYKTDSNAVEDLLWQDSLVPTAASVYLPLWACDLMLTSCCIRMRFQTS